MDAHEISALRLAVADARAQAEAAEKLAGRLEHLLRMVEAGAPDDGALRRPDGRLTEAGEAAVYEAMDRGDSDARIAETYKMSPGAVSYRRRRWRERPRHDDVVPLEAEREQGRVDPGAVQEAQAAATGADPVRTQADHEAPDSPPVYKKPDGRLTEAGIAKVDEGLAAGMTLTAIAKEVGVHISAISKRKKLMTNSIGYSSK